MTLCVVHASCFMLRVVRFVRLVAYAICVGIVVVVVCVFVWCVRLRCQSPFGSRWFCACKHNLRTALGARTVASLL